MRGGDDQLRAVKRISKRNLAQRDARGLGGSSREQPGHALALLGSGDGTVGNPHRAYISQFDMFELIVLLHLDEQFSVERPPL